MSKLKYLAAGILVSVFATNTQAQEQVVLASNYTIETSTTGGENETTASNTVAIKPAAPMALISTIDKGHIIKAKEMMDNGFDISAKDHNGQTALHHAAKMGYIELVKKLIREGADVNARDNKGNTALDIVENTEYKFPREPRVIARLLTDEMND